MSQDIVGIGGKFIVGTEHGIGKVLVALDETMVAVVVYETDVLATTTINLYKPDSLSM